MDKLISFSARARHDSGVVFLRGQSATLNFPKELSRFTTAFYISAMRIYTLGHSTHTLLEILELLRAHKIERVADVRSIPRSLYTPQFNRDTFSCFLRGRRIAYCWMKALGGRRSARRGSLNTAWRNKSFQGYADYMQSAEFRGGLAALLKLAREKRTAIMCAEAVPWRCHRSLIGDALRVRGVEVLDIFSASSVKPHRLTPFAHVDGMQLTYPPAAETEIRGPH